VPPPYPRMKSSMPQWWPALSCPRTRVHPSPTQRISGSPSSSVQRDSMKGQPYPLAKEDASSL
jgi:hypothetical protein